MHTLFPGPIKLSNFSPSSLKHTQPIRLLDLLDVLSTTKFEGVTLASHIPP